MKTFNDFDLLLKMFKVGKVDYIHESLIAYRVFSEQCTQTSSYELKFGEKNEIRNRYFNSLNLEHNSPNHKRRMRHEIKKRQ